MALPLHPLMNWRLEILKKKSVKTINGIWNCWFAADFMAVILVDKNKEAFPHTGNYFFSCIFCQKGKKPYFFVNQHGKPRIQKKSESAGVLLRELKKNAIITIDLNIWTATHTNSYLITENLNRQETASSLTLFSPCSLSFFLSCLDSFKEIVQFIIQQHNGLFPVLRDMYIWTCK